MGLRAFLRGDEARCDVVAPGYRGEMPGKRENVPPVAVGMKQHGDRFPVALYQRRFERLQPVACALPRPIGTVGTNGCLQDFTHHDLFIF
jgi:hypothetical protein